MHYIKLLSKILNIEYTKLLDGLKNAKVFEYYYNFFEGKPFAYIYDSYDFDIDRIEETIRQYIDFSDFCNGITISVQKADRYQNIIRYLNLNNKEILFVIELKGSDYGVIFFVYCENA